MGFRDLQRYEAQKPRYDAYKLWLAKSPAEKATAYDAVTDETKRVNIPREKGYVSPFGTAGTTKIYLPAKLIKENPTGAGAGTANILRTLLANYTTTATEFDDLTTPILVEAKEFKFAKLTLTEVTPGTTKKNSRITGAAYKKPEVDSVTSPFGQNAGGQAYDAAVLAIKGETAFTNFVDAANRRNRFRFSPEGA